MSNDHDLVQALEEAGHPDLAGALRAKVDGEGTVDDQPTQPEGPVQAEDAAAESELTEAQAIASALGKFTEGRRWTRIRA